MQERIWKSFLIPKKGFSAFWTAIIRDLKSQGIENMISILLLTLKENLILLPNMFMFILKFSFPLPKNNKR